MSIIKNLKKRIEIKIKINSSYPNVLEWLKSKKKLNRLYQDRKIESIYFDTFDLQSARDNIDGLPNRVKYRLRKYNDNNYNNSFIEFKIKLNKFNAKKIYPFKVNSKKIDFSNIFDLKTFNLINQANDALNLIGYKKLLPILEVSYLRSYYYFEDVIITLDRKIYYKLLSNYEKLNIKTDDATIIEIKANENKLNSVSNFIDEIPFRVTRNSKYITGLAMFGKVSYL
tara:strand:+ start:936 stop:1616 length:681 start_codon:yes stop_codon:yes gene_type:complete